MSEVTREVQQARDLIVVVREKYFKAHDEARYKDACSFLEQLEDLQSYLMEHDPEHMCAIAQQADEDFQELYEEV